MQPSLFKTLPHFGLSSISTSEGLHVLLARQDPGELLTMAIICRDTGNLVIVDTQITVDVGLLVSPDVYLLT